MPKVNYASASSGALAGGASGAAIGSVVPGIGTAIGAGAGAIVGGLSGLFGGGKAKKTKTKQVDLRTKDQKELDKLVNEGLTKGTGPFGDLFGKFNEEDFKKGVTEPELKKFKEQTLPALQEQFIAGNQSLGSGLRRAQTRSVTDLQERLAGLQYQAQNQQNQNRIAGITGQQRGGQVENLVTPGQPSAGQEFTKGVGENADKYLKVITDAFAKDKADAAKTPAVTTPAVSTSPGGI